MSRERDAQAALSAGVDQMAADLDALVETMTPEERAGALRCSMAHLQRVNAVLAEQRSPVTNVLAAVSLELTALVKGICGDLELDHGACDALSATFQRLRGLVEQAGRDLA